MSVHWHSEAHQCVESTQTILKQKAIEDGAPEGVVVVATEQKSGHGRHGRSWHSPPGNLYMSLLLRPECPAVQIGQLSLMISLSVYQAAGDVASGLEIKWPNDLLKDGKKCAGLILETELSGDQVDWLAVGIGVNVVDAPEEGSRMGAASVKLNDLKDLILEKIDQNYDLWRQGHFDEIRDKWLDAAHEVDTKMEIKLGKQREQGYFHGLDDNGNLRLKSDDGNVRTVSAGDVYLV